MTSRNAANRRSVRAPSKKVGSLVSVLNIGREQPFYSGLTVGRKQFGTVPLTSRTSRYNVFVRRHLKRYLTSLVFLVLLSLSIALGATTGVLFVYNSDLPQVDSLEDTRPSLITEVYSSDRHIIGSFAQERRFLVKWDEIPPVLRDA